MPFGQAVDSCLTLLLALRAANAAAAPFPTPLRLLEEVYVSTAKEDFNGHSDVFDDAVAWHRDRLFQSGSSGAHVACARDGDVLQARSILGKVLSPASVRALSNHKDHGTCFLVTASAVEAATFSKNPKEHGLSLFFLLPSVLKLAPGLLDHGSDDQAVAEMKRLQTAFGDRIRKTNNVHGLSLTLSPGILPTNYASSGQFMSSLQESFMSGSMDLHSANYWSNPDMIYSHQTQPEGSLRAREWTRAAHVVHQLSSAKRVSPGDICSWDDLIFHHPSDDHLILTGEDM